jgi:rare lipoprotein A
MHVRIAALYGIALLVAASPAARAQSGIASVYAYLDEKSASGEPTDLSELTAAHPTLPFGTLVRVTNQRNNLTVIVRINDRGPFVPGRIIDLTPAAAKILGFIDLATVTVEATPDLSASAQASTRCTTNSIQSDESAFALRRAP